MNLIINDVLMHDKTITLVLYNTDEEYKTKIRRHENIYAK